MIELGELFFNLVTLDSLATPVEKRNARVKNLLRRRFGTEMVKSMYSLHWGMPNMFWVPRGDWVWGTNPITEEMEWLQEQLRTVLTDRDLG